MSRANRLLTLGILLALTARADAGTNVWTSHGPDGASVRFIAVDPSTPTTVYAATEYGGVFRSLDGGSTWQAAHAGTGSAPHAVMGSAVVDLLAFDPQTSDTLYAGTEGYGLFRSTDAGESWSPLGAATFVPGQAAGQIYAIAVHPTSPTTMWVGTAAGIFKTTDGGTTWAASGLAGTIVGVLVVNPASPSTLYAGNFNGAYKSTNGGATWLAASSGLPAGSSIRDIAIHPTSPSTLYLTTPNAVFKTANGASTWTQVRSLANAFSLAIDPSVPSTIYVTTLGGGLFRSADNGAVWSSINYGDLVSEPYLYAVAVDPMDPQRIYVGADDGGGVIRTTDGGPNFARSNTGLSSTLATEVRAVPGSAGTTCIATGLHGVFRSVDAGESWVPSDNAGYSDLPAAALAVSPSTPNVAYVGVTGGVYRSTDTCMTWTYTSTANGLSDREVSAVAVDPTTPSVVWAGTSAGVFKTTNGGATWVTMNAGLPITTPGAFAIDPTDPATLYVGNTQGVFKTSTGGASWSPSSTGLTTTWIAALAMHSTTPTILYAGTFGGGVFVSVDGGASWSPIGGLTGSAAYVTALAVDGTAPGTIYAATAWTGVLKSADGGLTWQPRVSGMHNGRINALAIDSGDPRIVYAASTGAGVYVLEQENTCGNGVQEPDEGCDDGNLENGDCCSATCTLESAATICRSSAGACDVADYCTGTSAGCQADVKGTSVCRPSAGVCDVPEQCDGTGNDCPTDGLAASGTECRVAAGVCDVGETCTGASPACPADVKSTAVCRASAGPCDVTESCNGTDDGCPADAFVSAGSVCRAAVGTCDVAERCSGTAAACPADGGLPDNDGDALCDAVDPCTNVGGGRTLGGTNPIPKIVLNRINTDTVPGNDHLVLTGAFVLPATAAFADLNPQAYGARVLLRNRLGVAELDVTLPGGLFGGAGTRGWKLTNQGKTWTYTDSTAAPIGAVVTVNLWDRNTQLPGRVEIRVVGDDGTYPVVAGDEPIDAILTVGGPAQAAAGLCGETAFVPGDCFYNLSGNQLTCRP